MNKLKKSLPGDDVIPTLKQWLEEEAQQARLVNEIAEEEAYLSGKQEAFGKLCLAIAKNDHSTARTIMNQQKWTAESFPVPDAGNWHNEASLIFYGCWGNGITKMMDYKMLLFLADEDPASILSNDPDGVSMLHATLNSSPNPSVIKELLSRGVNPHRIDANKESYLDRLKATSPTSDTAEATATIISVVEKFMQAHTREECETREAEIKVQQKPSWVGRAANPPSWYITRP